MTPEQLQDFNRMKQDIQMLMRWMEEKKRQQISMPLDEASFGVLNQAFYNRTFDQLNSKVINDV